MGTTTLATFDGWELALDLPSEATELAWSGSPSGSEGLVVRDLTDADVEKLPEHGDLCVIGGRLGTRGLAFLGEWVARLAFVDCEFKGDFAPLARGRVRSLWIKGPAPLATKALQPLGRATSLDALYLDGTAPASAFRWLAPLARLERLDLSRAPGAPELGRGLAALAGLAALRQLGLRRAHVTETVLGHIAALPALTRLDLSYARVTARLRARPVLRGLEALRLRGVPGAVRLVEQFVDPGALRLLDLRDQVVTADTLARLQGLLPEGARVLVDPPPAPAGASVAAGAAPARLVRPALPEPALAAELLSFPDQAPTLAQLHVVIDDERGGPSGFDRRHDLQTVATRFHPASLVRFVAEASAPTDAERLIVALTLTPYALWHFDPNTTRYVDAALDAALALLGDTRGAAWTWGSMPQYHTFRFVVGSVAATTALNLIHWRADRRRTTLRADLDALHAVLLAELARDDGAPHAVASHLLNRTADADFPAAVAAWLDWLGAAVRDAGARPQVRVAALDRLDKDRSRMPASVRPAVDAAWDALLPELAALAVAPATEMRFRRAARKLVAERAPHLFDAMRGAGGAGSRSLPDFAELADHLGHADKAKVLPFAPDIDGATCMATLDADDLRGWFAALAIAPYCGDAAEARALAERAARLVGRAEQIALEGAPVDRSAPLGDVAAAALSVLIHARGVARDGLFGLVVDAVRPVPLGVNLTTPPGALTAFTVALPPSADGAAPPALLARFLDRTLAAAERFLYLLVCWPIRRDHAQRVLADATEDGDLRALVGCLSGLEQPADTPPLPMCEPFYTVPVENLRASLAIGTHPVSVRRATQALVVRLLPLTDDVAALRAGAAALRAIPVPPTLREIVDGAESMGRGMGARWLAVLGAHEDEGRIARVMVEEGGWTPTRPQGYDGPPRTPLEQMMAALVPESVVDHCDSDFDPLLEIGYGPQGAARVRAKAYALIARRHADAGRLRFARRSMEYAAQLDPMNLDVARLRRSLPDA